MYYLYKKHFTETTENISSVFGDHCDIQMLSPNPFRYKLKEERITFKQYLSRSYFWIITAGKYKIYFLCNGNEVAHSSYVVPKCFKFLFMGEKDFEIGPCVTSAEYRRQGCYSYMLNYITALPEYSDSDFYMVVRSTNKPSIKGIEKSGFMRCGSVERKRFFKQYVKGNS